ncbi:4Fe-4S dicluster domain-containing protein [candidate division WOR-3 bacterium]|nr:4Fe-4S dicluster domain-containing protein [candidate division WOR-3 bacterium]MCK4576794.1 4Fe-4S dicluster domain-containing protein [candidate division WOR-3 bacterium]
MEKIDKKIREIASKLLKEGKVKLIIGFEKGTLPLKARPTFVRKPEEVEKLIWSSLCENNLAVYIPFYRKQLDNAEKIGVIAKGCDTRSLILHIQENIAKREQIVIIGVPCEGMLDRKKIEREVTPGIITESTENDDSITVKGNGFEKTLKKKDFLCEDCIICSHRKPIVYDEIVDIEIKEPEGVDVLNKVNEFESKEPEERWKAFTEEVSRCIRCYACRNACPACYCNECFVDCSRPQWLGTTVDSETDLQLFQIIRTFHLAGRCVNCGSCSRACPMDIDISLLVSKLSTDAKQYFGYETGVDIEGKPVLNKYSEDDSNEGFFEER